MRTSGVRHQGERHGRASDVNRRPPAPGGARDAGRLARAVGEDPVEDPVDDMVDELHAARVRRLREQVADGTYDPPADAVAERLAAFFTGTAVLRFGRRG